MTDVAEGDLIERGRQTAEAELSKLTEKDMQNLLIVGGISLFGVWLMTIGDKMAARDDEEDEDALDVCALCGYSIDPREGSTFLDPSSRRRLGVRPGEAVCKHCLSEHSR